MKILVAQGTLVGAISTTSFFVDDKEGYGLRRGERYGFAVDPGWHSLSYLIGLNDYGQKFEFSARGQYTFRLLPTCGIEQTEPRSLDHRAADCGPGT